MKYITNPIANAKQRLAFRGIVIQENIRQVEQIKAVTKLEKAFREVVKGNVKNGNDKGASRFFSS